MENLDINSVNPHIRVAMRSVMRRGSVIKQRIIYDYELIFIERGSMLFCYDGVSYTPSRGDFLFIRPGIPHSFDCSNEELSQPHVHFDLTYDYNSKRRRVSFKDAPDMSAEELALVESDAFRDYPRTPIVSFNNKTLAVELLFRIIDSFTSGKILAAKGALTTLLSELIYDNYPNAFSKSGSGLGISRQVKDYIDSTRGVQISLDGLQMQFSYSKFYLERGFKAKYGICIIAYANKLRLEYAAELLATLSVLETAEKTAFSSIYAFSRAFKNHYGISPSEYKKRRYSH